LIGKDKLILILAAFCLVIAGLIFYYNNIVIPNVQQKTELQVRRDIDLNAMPKVKTAIVTGNQGIARYTLITEDIADSCISIVEIPEKYAAKNVVTDKSQLINKVAKEDLRPGEQILNDSLSQDVKWFKDFERLKEFEVYGIVAGEVKSGNIVDILVNYGNGDYDVVVPKIKVHKLLEGSGRDGNNSKAHPGESYKIILSVDEDQYRDLEIAKKLGVLETRLYIDESQPTSAKTFVYEKAVEKLNIIVENNKGIMDDEARGQIQNLNLSVDSMKSANTPENGGAR